MSALIDDHCPVLLAEGATDGRKQVQHAFGRATETDALDRLHKWAVDEDWLRQHRIQQCAVAEHGVIQPTLQIRRAFLTNRLAHGQAGAANQFDQSLP